MNLAQLILSLILGWPPIVDISQTARPGDEPVLVLSTRLMGERYCHGDRDLDGISLKLRLHYTNNGPTPIILYKYSNLVLRTMISHSHEAAAAGRFEVNASLYTITAGTEPIDSPTPGGSFVVLEPGHSYDTDGAAGVFAIRDENKPITGAVGSGTHFLQIQVATWPEGDVRDSDPDRKVVELRHKWQTHGNLWSKAVTSSPMQFDVKAHRHVVNCK